MLIDNNGIEAEAIGKQEFGDILLVQLVTEFSVVIFVREVDPQRLKSF